MHFYGLHVYSHKEANVYNEKYFQKVSFCVITHPIGQNGRAVCKKHGNQGDARGAKLCASCISLPCFLHTALCMHDSIFMQAPLNIVCVSAHAVI